MAGSDNERPELILLMALNKCLARLFTRQRWDNRDSITLARCIERLLGVDHSHIAARTGIEYGRVRQIMSLCDGREPRQDELLAIARALLE